MQQSRAITFEELSPLAADRWHALVVMSRTELISQLTQFTTRLGGEDPRTGVKQFLNAE